GHKLWTRHFDADPSVVGRSITLDGNRYTVVGVMPPGFQHPVMAELWTPLALTPEQATTPEPRFLRLVARLKPGVSLREAQAAVDRVSARLARERKDTHDHWGAVVTPIESRYTGDIKPALLALVGAVGFVLLTACHPVSAGAGAHGLSALAERRPAAGGRGRGRAAGRRPPAERPGGGGGGAGPRPRDGRSAHDPQLREPAAW